MVHASCRVSISLQLFRYVLLLSPNKENSDKLTFFFLPPEWRDTFSAPGWVALTGIVALEVLGLLSPFPALRVASLDYYAHLGGYLTGALWAVAWKAERAKKQKENRPWLEKVCYRE